MAVGTDLDEPGDCHLTAACEHEDFEPRARSGNLTEAGVCHLAAVGEIEVPEGRASGHKCHARTVRDVEVLQPGCRGGDLLENGVGNPPATGKREVREVRAVAGDVLDAMRAQLLAVADVEVLESWQSLGHPAQHKVRDVLAVRKVEVLEARERVVERLTPHPSTGLFFIGPRVPRAD